MTEPVKIRVRRSTEPRATNLAPDPAVAARACDSIEEMAIRHDYTVRQELKALGVARATFDAWQRGTLPSATALQRMARSGYDVLYILTGSGRNEPGDPSLTVRMTP